MQPFTAGILKKYGQQLYSTNAVNVANIKEDTNPG
jgi:hypothetical protein